MPALASSPPTPDPRALFAGLGSSPIEIAAIGYFDPKWRILGIRHIAGGIGSVAAPIRRIVRDALAFDAALIVLAHNHPSGDPAPSRDDIAFTRALARTLDPIEVRLVDHLIVTRAATTSLRDLGML